MISRINRDDIRNEVRIEEALRELCRVQSKDGVARVQSQDMARASVDIQTILIRVLREMTDAAKWRRCFDMGHEPLEVLVPIEMKLNSGMVFALARVMDRCFPSTGTESKVGKTMTVPPCALKLHWKSHYACGGDTWHALPYMAMQLSSALNPHVRPVVEYYDPQMEETSTIDIIRQSFTQILQHDDGYANTPSMRHSLLVCFFLSEMFLVVELSRLRSTIFAPKLCSLLEIPPAIGHCRKEKCSP